VISQTVQSKSEKPKTKHVPQLFATTSITSDNFQLLPTAFNHHKTPLKPPPYNQPPLFTKHTHEAFFNLFIKIKKMLLIGCHSFDWL